LNGNNNKHVSQVFLVQTGETIWEAQDRIESVAGAPLTEDGTRDVERAAQELASCQTDIRVVYACDGESERQTAELIAKALNAKVRLEPELRELDYGLWQGLTKEEFKRRQPRLYRQWAEAPASIRPPGGETLDEAQARLKTVVKEILKRHREDAALVVLRPVAVGLLQCLLTNDPVERIWRHVDGEFTWESYEMDSVVL